MKHTERSSRLSQAKEQIFYILGEIQYEGHFDKVFCSLSLRRQEVLIEWVEECKEGKRMPISSKKRDILGFVLKFRDTNFRAILTKEKNGYFLALYLDKHKYYEQERSRLGI